MLLMDLDIGFKKFSIISISYLRKRTVLEIFNDNRHGFNFVIYDFQIYQEDIEVPEMDLQEVLLDLYSLEMSPPVRFF